MQRHFKPASKPGLAGVSPGDDVFLIAQESDTPVFPPSSADLEDLRIAKTAWATTYAEADDEDSMASARELSHKYESLEAARIDPMETARRIWEWWRARLWKVNVFKYWSKAARLVALVQTSSARIERVFSQLKLILETIGFSALEKTVEGRLFTRVNKGQYGE